jgi:hypothetical protein
MEWISVKQMLPEQSLKRVDVWINREGGYRFANYHLPQSFDNDSNVIKEDFELNNVTHWMMKPEPPKYDYQLCKEKINGSCPHHNLHCGYPDCERVKLPEPPKQ